MLRWKEGHVRNVLPGRPDIRPAQAVTTDQRINAVIQPRVVPMDAWIAKAKAQQEAGEEVTPPCDDEQELVIGIRAMYLIPSGLVPEEQWPVVGTDLGIELGRVRLSDLKARVHAHLEKTGNTLASKVVPQLSGGQ